MGELYGFLVWLALSAALAAVRHGLSLTLRARHIRVANGRTEPPSDIYPHPYYERGQNG